MCGIVMIISHSKFVNIHSICCSIHENMCTSEVIRISSLSMIMCLYYLQYLIFVSVYKDFGQHHHNMCMWIRSFASSSFLSHILCLFTSIPTPFVPASMKIWIHQNSLQPHSMLTTALHGTTYQIIVTRYKYVYTWHSS